jgi:hypothetical protein
VAVLNYERSRGWRKWFEQGHKEARNEGEQAGYNRSQHATFFAASCPRLWITRVGQRLGRSGSRLRKSAPDIGARTRATGRHLGETLANRSVIHQYRRLTEEMLRACLKLRHYKQTVHDKGRKRRGLRILVRLAEPWKCLSDRGTFIPVAGTRPSFIFSPHFL